MSFVHKPIDLGYDNLGDASTETQRYYVTPSGEKYPSITTVLAVNGNEYLEGWRKAVGEVEAARVCHHAVTRGNAMHDLAERYLDNEFEETPKGLMPHVNLAFNTLKLVLDSSVGTIMLQECPLYSDLFQIAGRVDLIAEFDGELAVVDFKTSKRVKNAEDIENYFLQSSFYAAAFYERTGVPIKSIVIIMIVDESKTPLIFKQRPFDFLPKLMSVREKYRKMHKI
jgi:hypothetical protein